MCGSTCMTSTVSVVLQTLITEINFKIIQFWKEPFKFRITSLKSYCIMLFVKERNKDKRKS